MTKKVLSISFANMRIIYMGEQLWKTERSTGINIYYIKNNFKEKVTLIKQSVSTKKRLATWNLPI